MFDITSLIIFISAALALIVSPGPAVLFVVARSLEQGRVAGIVSTLGITFASLIHVVFAAIGLSALLMKSALAFSVIKYLGAAYLIYLGIRALTTKAQAANVQEVEPVKLSTLFVQGFIVNIFNPKTALFFLAFLPQFVDPSRGSALLQIIVLGTIFLVMALVSDSMYAVVAGTAKELLLGSSGVSLRMARAQKYIAGTIYIALGITTALSGNSRLK